MALVAQTTQNKENFKRTISVLKKKTKKLKWLNTICPEVSSRQKEIRDILQKCDGVLVIGSRLSANTRRLTEKVKNLNKKLFWINSLKELKSIMPQMKCKKLGIISGTSTPEWEINKIRKYLKEYAEKTKVIK